MSKVTVDATPEMMGLIADGAALKADAAGYIKSKTGADLSGNDIKVVENSSTTVHVSLPFYSALESAAAAIGEDELDAAGGALPHLHMAADRYRMGLEHSRSNSSDAGTSYILEQSMAIHDNMMASDQADSYMEGNFGIKANK